MTDEDRLDVVQAPPAPEDRPLAEVAFDTRGGLTIHGRPVPHVGLRFSCEPPDYLGVVEVELPIVDVSEAAGEVRLIYVARSGQPGLATVEGRGPTALEAMRDLVRALEEEPPPKADAAGEGYG